MHADPLALAAFQGPLASKGVLLFVILLTALLILMIYAVVRAPAWQPTRPPEGAGPRPGDRPAPLPRRRAPDPASPAYSSALPPAPTGRHAAASAGPAGAAVADVAPVPHPAEPDPPVLERPVVTGRPPWGPAPRPPGVI
jgi:predicted lipid-binding transport protein (Tim44 family)